MRVDTVLALIEAGQMQAPARRIAQLANTLGRGETIHLRTARQGLAKRLANGACRVFGWLTLMIVITATGHEEAREISVFQVELLRSTLGMAMLLVRAVGGLAAVRTERLPQHVLRKTETANPSAEASAISCPASVLGLVGDAVIVRPRAGELGWSSCSAA